MQDTFTLKAGQIWPVNVSGKFLTVVKSTAPFQVELGQGGRKNVQRGSVVGGVPFSRVVFTETGGADNTITYDVSDAPAQFVDSRSTQSYGQSATGNCGTGIGPAPGVIFPGVDADGNKRKKFYVQNVDTNGHDFFLLTFQNGSYDGSITIYANAVRNIYEFETDVDLALYDPNHATTLYAVMEIFEKNS